MTKKDQNELFECTSDYIFPSRTAESLVFTIVHEYGAVEKITKRLIGSNRFFIVDQFRPNEWMVAVRSSNRDWFAGVINEIVK